VTGPESGPESGPAQPRGRTARLPRLYFSFRSPYSWMTVHRLRQAVPDAFDALEWLPYWDPDPGTAAGLAERGGQFHYTQMSRAKHLYLLLDTKRIAQRLGLAMAWPIDVEPHWELPHLGWLVARRLGRGPEFYDQVVQARWQRGENVCDERVLRGCAARAGLDPDQILAAHTDPAVRAQAVECLYQAYLDDIFGIPYVKWGRHRYWGLERLDAFLAVWSPGAGESGAGTPETVAVGVTAGYDTDTPGGCG